MVLVTAVLCCWRVLGMLGQGWASALQRQAAPTAPVCVEDTEGVCVCNPDALYLAEADHNLLVMIVDDDMLVLPLS
jgi:hypothetical protein